MWLLDYLLDRWQWYRKMRGGHWELWDFYDPGPGLTWIHREECYFKAGPPGLGLAMYECEDWSLK